MRQVLAFLVLFGALPSPLLAQDRAVIEETAPAPGGARSVEVRGIVASDGNQTRMTYATRITGDLADGRTKVLAPEEKSAPQTLPIPRMGGMSTVFVVLLVIGAVLLWLRFGGAGMLLAKAPTSQPKPVAAPAAWNISATEQAGDPRHLLDQIAAMPDRAAALVRLLRHCLLTAATETDTRLARADTERLAFDRLPEGWRARTALRGILSRAELAHYGGRAVDEDDFAATLDLGRTILLRQGPGHA